MNTMSEKESQMSRRLLGSFLLCEFRYCRAMLVAFAIPLRCCFFLSFESSNFGAATLPPPPLLSH